MSDECILIANTQALWEISLPFIDCIKQMLFFYKAVGNLVSLKFFSLKKLLKIHNDGYLTIIIFI